ncbi:MAG: hypothetical protein ABIJ17_02470 [Patescibacteria group bacterium]
MSFKEKIVQEETKEKSGNEKEDLLESTIYKVKKDILKNKIKIEKLIAENVILENQVKILGDLLESLT